MDQHAAAAVVVVGVFRYTVALVVIGVNMSSSFASSFSSCLIFWFSFPCSCHPFISQASPSSLTHTMPHSDFTLIIRSWPSLAVRIRNLNVTVGRSAGLLGLGLTAIRWMATTVCLPCYIPAAEIAITFIPINLCPNSHDDGMFPGKARRVKGILVLIIWYYTHSSCVFC